MPPTQTQPGMPLLAACMGTAGAVFMRVGATCVGAACSRASSLSNVRNFCGSLANFSVGSMSRAWRASVEASANLCSLDRISARM